MFLFTIVISTVSSLYSFFKQAALLFEFYGSAVVSLLIGLVVENEKIGVRGCFAIHPSSLVAITR
jgi:hypothetical protein